MRLSHAITHSVYSLLAARISPSPSVSIADLRFVSRQNKSDFGMRTDCLRVYDSVLRVIITEVNRGGAYDFNDER